MNVAIIDYGIGNVKSIINALKSLGVNAKLTNNRNEIINAEKVILPGVGAFGTGMANLKKFNLISIIHDYVKTGKPLLGICLGMQMLLEESEEFGITQGLQLIQGKVIKIPTNNNPYIKLPHVSWNNLLFNENINKPNSIFKNVAFDCDVYFVHSFVASPTKQENITALTEYEGIRLCAAVQYENVYGVQFHPEKSGIFGLEILKNFINL